MSVDGTTIDVASILGSVSLIVSMLLGLGMYINSRRGVSQRDRELTTDEQQARHAREDMVMRERREELERLYPQLREMREHIKQMEILERRLWESDRREWVLYQHVKDLRNHIVEEKPPPPPAMPPELVEWFEDFGATEPSHRYD